jgi:hypothetical protein
MGSPPHVSQAAPVPPGADDDDDGDELLEDDESLEEDELVVGGAVAGCFLSLLHAATSAATHSNARTRLMAIVRCTGADGARRMITT